MVRWYAGVDSGNPPIKDVFNNTELDKYPFLNSIKAVLDAQLSADQEVYNKDMAEERKRVAEEIFKWISCNAPHYQCKECGYEQHLDDDFYTFEAETLAKYGKSNPR